MKTLRVLSSLFFAAALVGSAAFAADKAPAAKPAEPKKEAKADCGCETGKDGKVCGIDKDCCCSGEKAKGRSAEKKPEGKKTAMHCPTTEGCNSCGA